MRTKPTPEPSVSAEGSRMEGEYLRALGAHPSLCFHSVIPPASEKFSLVYEPALTEMKPTNTWSQLNDVQAMIIECFLSSGSEWMTIATIAHYVRKRWHTLRAISGGRLLVHNLEGFLNKVLSESADEENGKKLFEGNASKWKLALAPDERKKLVRMLKAHQGGDRSNRRRRPRGRRQADDDDDDDEEDEEKEKVTENLKEFKMLITKAIKNKGGSCSTEEIVEYVTANLQKICKEGKKFSRTELKQSLVTALMTAYRTEEKGQWTIPEGAEEEDEEMEAENGSGDGEEDKADAPSNDAMEVEETNDNVNVKEEDEHIDVEDGAEHADASDSKKGGESKSRVTRATRSKGGDAKEDEEMEDVKEEELKEKKEDDSGETYLLSDLIKQAITEEPTGVVTFQHLIDYCTKDWPNVRRKDGSFYTSDVKRALIAALNNQPASNPLVKKLKNGTMWTLQTKQWQEFAENYAGDFKKDYNLAYAKMGIDPKALEKVSSSPPAQSQKAAAASTAAAAATTTTNSRSRTKRGARR